MLIFKTFFILGDSSLISKHCGVEMGGPGEQLSCNI